MTRKTKTTVNRRHVVKILTKRVTSTSRVSFVKITLGDLIKKTDVRSKQVHKSVSVND